MPDLAPLYLEHCALLRNYIRKGVDYDNDLADDFAGDVWLRLVEAAHRGTAIRNLRAYLFRTAQNLIADYRRRGRAARIWHSLDTMDSWHEDEAAPHQALCLDDPAEQVTTQLYVETLMRRGQAQLTPEQARVLGLLAEGYSYDEIAALTQRTRGSVKQLRNRAIDILRGIA